MSDQYEETYYIVPTYIRKLPGMTLGYMDVYAVMFQFWNKGRPCFLSNGAFVSRTGYKTRYIQEAFSYFEGLGELKRIEQGNKRYLVKPISIIETDIETISQPEANNDGKIEGGALQRMGGCSAVHGGGAPQCTEKQNENISEPPQDIACSGPSFALNKEVLNKENNRTHTVCVDLDGLQNRAARANIDINISDLGKLVARHGFGYIDEKIEVTECTPNAYSPTAFFKTAIKSDYKLPPNKLIFPIQENEWTPEAHRERVKKLDVISDPNHWAEQMIQEKIKQLQEERNDQT